MTKNIRFVMGNMKYVCKTRNKQGILEMKKLMPAEQLLVDVREVWNNVNLKRNYVLQHFKMMNDKVSF